MKQLLLHIVSLPVFSRIYGRLTRLRRPRFLIRFIVARFAAHYRIDLLQFQGQPQDYPSLSDFFVRPLDPVKRPLEPDPAYILSPCDSILADQQVIHCDLAVQAKGREYRISDLIGRELDWSAGWRISTLYLSPADYHRFHYPWSGTLKEIVQLGNRLFPVNRHGVERISNLFARNERLVLEFDTDGHICFAVAVGATFVGSIALCALNNNTLKEGRVKIDQRIEQLDEMGRFNLGSTIILVFPKSMGQDMKPTGSRIRTGDALYRRAG